MQQYTGTSTCVYIHTAALLLPTADATATYLLY